MQSSGTGTPARAMADEGTGGSACANGCAPVAQLDRALAYEARGRVFESPRAYHNPHEPKPTDLDSTESHDRMWRVGFLERRNLLRLQAQRERCHSLLEVVWFGGADDGRGDGRLPEHPGKRQRSAGNATLFCHLTQAIYDFAVNCFRLRIQALAEPVGLEALGLFCLPGTRQSTPRQGTPGDDGDALRLAERQHLTLFFTIKKVVMVLHGNETGPAVQVGEIKRLR